MKIFKAMYCCSIHESSYATLSIHKTKKGAEKAVEEHKAKEKEQWYMDPIEYKNSLILMETNPEDIEDLMEYFNERKFGEHEEWCVEEDELID